MGRKKFTFGTRIISTPYMLRPKVAVQWAAAVLLEMCRTEIPAPVMTVTARYYVVLSNPEAICLNSSSK